MSGSIPDRQQLAEITPAAGGGGGGGGGAATGLEMSSVVVDVSGGISPPATPANTYVLRAVGEFGSSFARSVQPYFEMGAPISRGEVTLPGAASVFIPVTIPAGTSLMFAVWLNVIGYRVGAPPGNARLLGSYILPIVRDNLGDLIMEVRTVVPEVGFAAVGPAAAGPTLVEIEILSGFLAGTDFYLHWAVSRSTPLAVL